MKIIIESSFFLSGDDEMVTQNSTSRIFNTAGYNSLTYLKVKYSL